MTRWVRLWEDMPTDPKWRVIARRSGRPLAEVLAVFVFMMTRADAAGTLDGWQADDIAAALDTEPEAVLAIYDAMQGKTLDGDCLTGWQRRQPKRHDDHSTERVRAFRDRKRSDETLMKRTETHGNARIEESREDKKEPEPNGSGPAEPVEVTPLQRVWSEGVPNLVALGVSEKQARSVIGLWLKDAGDDPLRVLGAIQRSREHAAANPIPWITAGFAKIASKRKTSDDRRNELLAALDGPGPVLRVIDGEIVEPEGSLALVALRSSG